MTQTNGGFAEAKNDTKPLKMRGKLLRTPLSGMVAQPYTTCTVARQVILQRIIS